MECISDANYTNPAKMIDVVHYNHCCAYNHQARGPFDYFDEFYNNTKLDRYSNFTLFLEIGHNVTLPEKCMNLTCKQIEGIPVLSPEFVFRSCNCCIYNGSLYPDGTRNITLNDGRNASCCNGELVMPIEVNETMPMNNNNSSQQPIPSAFSNLDTNQCWSECFKSDNNHHKKFLEIIQKLQAEQAAKNTQGTCFVLDGSTTALADSSLYNYERNLAILLSLTLPVNSSNPMFAVKYQNYEACSEYHYDMQCKNDKCSAAKTLAGHKHMLVYEAISSQKPQLGMMWHGMALAHQAITDSRCTLPHSNEMVIGLVNKQWLNNGLGGGNAYHPNWVGPDMLGRTVASIGVDNALQYQMEAASSSPDLVWSLNSDSSWKQELHDLVSCIDTRCCNGQVAVANGGHVPKSVLKSFLGSGVVSINGTDLNSVKWIADD